MVHLLGEMWGKPPRPNEVSSLGKLSVFFISYNLITLNDIITDLELRERIVLTAPSIRTIIPLICSLNVCLIAIMSILGYHLSYLESEVMHWTTSEDSDPIYPAFLESAPRVPDIIGREDYVSTVNSTGQSDGDWEISCCEIKSHRKCCA